MRTLFVSLLTLLLTACASTATPAAETPPPPIIRVHASTAAQPWLEQVYACGQTTHNLIILSISESAADVRLRVGEPPSLTGPAYQIGSEDLLIVTGRTSPLQNLDAAQARALFSQGQAGIQLWMYASGEDIQQVFERQVMQSTGIHSLARLAAHPQEILGAINNDPATVGLLTGHWKAASLRVIYTLPGLPVLAIPTAEVSGALKDLLACLMD